MFFISEQITVLKNTPPPKKKFRKRNTEFEILPIVSDIFYIHKQILAITNGKIINLNFTMFFFFEE